MPGGIFDYLMGGGWGNPIAPGMFDRPEDRFAAQAQAPEQQDPRYLDQATDYWNRMASGDVAREGLNYYNRNPMEAGMAFAPGSIRAYHYSPHDFSAFDMSKAGSVTDPGMMGRAMYFSTDPAVAKAGPHRYEVDLDIKSPLNIEHPPDYRTATKSDLAGAALDLPPPTKGALAIGKQSPTLPDWQQWAEQMAAAAKARGHDAAVLDYSPTGYPHQEIAVYDPAIIKFLRQYGLLPPLAAGGALGFSGNDR